MANTLVFGNVAFPDTPAGTFLDDEGGFSVPGLVIGNTVTGGGANRVLYQDGSQDLAASAKMTFDGDIFKNETNNTPKVGVLRTGAAFAALFAGTTLSLFQFSSAHKFGIQAATDLSDAGSSNYSQMVFGSNRRTLFGDLGAGQTDIGIAHVSVLSTSPQLALAYDASNYFKTTVSSAGAVTFDAVGSSPSIRLDCVGEIRIGDFEGVVNTTEFIVDDANQRWTFSTNNSLTVGAIAFPIVGAGVMIGETAADLFAFWGQTPITQPGTGGAAASFTANSGTSLNTASTFDGYTVAQVVAALRSIGLLA